MLNILPGIFHWLHVDINAVHSVCLLFCFGFVFSLFSVHILKYYIELNSYFMALASSFLLGQGSSAFQCLPPNVPSSDPMSLQKSACPRVLKNPSKHAHPQPHNIVNGKIISDPSPPHFQPRHYHNTGFSHLLALFGPSFQPGPLSPLLPPLTSFLQSSRSAHSM